jgi:microcystin-dependent protein
MAGATKITERGVDGVAFEANTPASQPGDVFPAGAVMMWAGPTPPAGWMICDGTAISRAGFPSLFANIAVTWGAGNGTTTFNIPDFRDRVPVGNSGTKALASSGGVETVALSVAEMPTHSHGGNTGGRSAGHTHAIAVERFDSGNGVSLGASFINSVLLAAGAGGTAYGPLTGGESVDHSHSIGAEGSGSAHTNMQPYRAINYIIRAY